MNVFDNLADTAFDLVTNTMGYQATWQPLAGGDLQTATVLYNDDTDKYELSNMDYDPADYRMEYRAPFFPTLKASVGDNHQEQVSFTIKDVVKVFYVTKVDTKYDGNTLIASLMPV